MAEHRALVPMFELMRELFEVLNGRRRRRGSIDFDLPESEVMLDADGFIENIVASERNVAHRLIEEFMLLANETVAHELESREMPSLYRIHETPDPLKVLQFEEFVSSFGFSLGAPQGGVTPMHFQKLVDRIRGVPAERPIAMLMLRTMQKARYDPTNVGHFGLAAETYTHFTSPIRRYPDLVVHRVLRELRQTRVSDERRAELAEDLPEIGRHTSEMERRAAEAERELLQWKKVRFMADKVGDVFDGYITGVAPFGLFVELIDHYVEGLVHVSTMADDYYRFNEAGARAVRREHPEDLPPRRPRARPDRQGRHGAPADRPRPGGHPPESARGRAAAAGRGAAAPGRRRSSGSRRPSSGAARSSSGREGRSGRAARRTDNE